MADAAAGLHGQRGLFHRVEDGAEVVLDPPHDEAIEQRYIAFRASAGENASGGQEGEVLHGAGKQLGPEFALRFSLGLCRSLRHPHPGVGDGLIDGAPVGGFQPVFLIPDLLGDGRQGVWFVRPISWG